MKIKLNKRQKKILTWIVVWAGLLIVVLYSPVGSPGLYSSQNYYADSQSAPLKSGGIINSPKGTSSSVDDDNGSVLPDMSTTTPGTNYSTGNYQSANTTSRGSSYSSQQSAYQNTNPLSTGSSGGAGASIIASGSSRSSNATSGIAMTNGITSITTTNLSTTKQSSPSSIQATAGGTDPGGDPTGDPIPVGDGWWALLLFGGIYVVLKKKFTSRKAA